MNISGIGQCAGDHRETRQTSPISAGTLLLSTLFLALVAGDAWAAPVCPESPVTTINAGDRIECTKDSMSTDNIDIDAVDVDIDTTADNEPGIQAEHAGTGDIDIDVMSSAPSTPSTIDTNGLNSYGIRAKHTGDGDIDIDLDNVTIDTNQMAASIPDGIHIRHEGTGDIDVQVKDTTSNSGFVSLHHGEGSATMKVMSTILDSMHGIYNENVIFSGDPDKTVPTHSRTYVTDSEITARDEYGAGIAGTVSAASIEGEVLINVDNSIITTTGQENAAIGIFAINQADVGDVSVTVHDSEVRSMYTGIQAKRETGRGAVVVDVRNSDIFTTLPEAIGIHAVNNLVDSIADDVLEIFVQDSTITTMSPIAHGILATRSNGNGDIRIDLRDVTIQSNSVLFAPGTTITVAQAVYGYNTTEGDIIIDARAGTDISTKGAFSYGLRGFAAGEGDILITTHAGSSITNTGTGGHGIDARNTSTDVMDDTRSIAITVGGDITASGEDAHGVRIGTGSAGFVGLDEDGYRRQTVTVNGQVTGGSGTGAGIYLSNGGRVVIGPRGSINAASGIAILATGTVPEDNTDQNNVIPPIPPKLRVDLNLGGRQVSEAIGDDWIINDGGETTIAVNNTVLHDGAMGVTGNTAYNGAWDVTMREHGFKVDNRTDPEPANWVLTESTDADPIIEDRDFSSADFTEMEVRCPAGQIGFPNCRRAPPPPPRMCPVGQVGTPPNCMEPEPEPEPEVPMLMEEYAPRAALYETLPGFLLRMTEQGPLSRRLVSSETPVWFAFSGGDGSVDSSRSTTGAEYDYDHFMVQLGKNLVLGEGLDGRFAAHYIQGDSDVSSPTGGGDIEAEGKGVAFDIQWHHASGYYLGGHASLSNYDIDLSSDNIGRLISNVDALGTSFGLETGMRLAMGESLHLMPRAWLSHSSIDIDNFTDTVDARASFSDETRLSGGIGASAETMRHWNGGELTWRGSLDIEQRLNSRSTSVNVSGEKLKTETATTRLLLGLGSLYRKGDFSISAQISADGLGTNDEKYSGQLNIGVRL